MRRQFHAFWLTLAIFTGFSVPAAALNIKEVKSPGGITAWLVEDHSLPVISLSFAFRGGAVNDPAGKEGRAQLVSSLLNEGAGDMDSQAFQARLEDLAISLRFSAGTERFGGAVRTLSENRNEAFRLLKLALTEPRFDKEPVERIRAQTIAGLKSSLKRPGTIANRAWYKAMFPDHPYGRPNGGTVASINAITIADLRDFVGKVLVRDRVIVGVAGDITPAELGKRLDEIFGGLPKSQNQQGTPPVVKRANGSTIVIEKEIPQSVAFFGHYGIKRNDPDWYAALVMNRILGSGGFSSRLNEEVREKRGLAYSVHSWLNPFDQAGVIAGNVATANARIGKSLEVIRAEWKKMAEKGVSAEELANAKTYINGSFPLRLDSTRRIARILVSVQMNRLGIDYLGKRASLINQVTVQDIARVARRMLDPGKLVIVVVGKPEGLKSSP